MFPLLHRGFKGKKKLLLFKSFITAFQETVSITAAASFVFSRTRATLSPSSSPHLLSRCRRARLQRQQQQRSQRGPSIVATSSCRRRGRRGLAKDVYVLLLSPRACVHCGRQHPNRGVARRLTPSGGGLRGCTPVCEKFRCVFHSHTSATHAFIISNCAKC